MMSLIEHVNEYLQKAKMKSGITLPDKIQNKYLKRGRVSWFYPHFSLL